MTTDTHEIASRNCGRTRTGLGAAICAALASAGAMQAQAQEQEREQQADSGPPLEVIIVTATRREANIQSIPFNISAVGPEAIERQRLDDLAELTQVVPGLYLANQGPRSSNFMTVRGLNVSSLRPSEALGNGTGGTVATYIGEIPLYVDLKMIDLARVEALLGPQGTLYGVGTLGGAIRYIPNRPDPVHSDADVNARLYALNQSDGMGYDVDGMLNVPLVADRLALRLAASYTDDPGFIDYDYVVREPGVSNPQPDFNDPADVEANLRRVRDADDEQTVSGRVGLLWQITDDLIANLTYYYQDQDVGARTINHRRALGTGKYVSADRFLEPFEQKNHLGALEIEWDLGFASLTSATGVSKYESDGQRDQTDLLLDFGFGYEDFPSFVAYTSDQSDQKTFNQEFRLVSQGDSRWNWIVGVFYNRFTQDTSSREFVPGYPEFAGLPPDATTLEYLELNDETLEERAVYGELGFRFTDRWQATVGARWFKFDDDVETEVALPLLGELLGGVDTSSLNRNRTSDDDAIFKFNTSYQFTENVMSYLTVSEGYRQGGVNTGPLCDESVPPDEQNPCLLPDEVLIKPDTTINYELGLHSAWLNAALLVNAAVYLIDWKDIQVADLSENGALPITRNGSSARSQGFELSTQWQLGPSLSVSASYAYNDAKLTKNSEFLVDGTPAFDGDRLAGTPQQQGRLFVNYSLPLANGWTFEADYGITAISNVYTKVGLRNNGEVLPGFALHSVAVGVSTDRWHARLYADNLFDKYAVTSVRRDTSYIRPVESQVNPDLVWNLRSYFQSPLRPLSVGIELGYKFDL